MLISKKTLNNLEKRLNNLEKAFLKLCYIQSKRNSDFPCSKVRLSKIIAVNVKTKIAVIIQIISQKILKIFQMSF